MGLGSAEIRVQIDFTKLTPRQMQIVINRDGVSSVPGVGAKTRRLFNQRWDTSCSQVMSFFPDLSPYSYHRSDIRTGTLNIGWLETKEPFPKGTVSDTFLKKLWQFCKLPVVQTRGFHVCDLCNMRTDVVPLVEFQGETLELGSAEIRVFAKGGQIYAAPNLIFHYVRVHGYKPLQAFIDAVLAEPGPESEEYRVRLRALSLSE